MLLRLLLLLQVYQDLCKKHTTFRERSENVDLAVSETAEYAKELWQLCRRCELLTNVG
jgi:hypothetical protein